jgi:hypothetical protein
MTLKVHSPGGSVMSAEGGTQALLAMKKLWALVLLAAGMGAIAVGLNGENYGVVILGALFIAAAIALLAWKVVRRNSLP